jgi:predicted membrane protein
MKHVKFMLAIILMLVVVILIVQNHEALSTKVSFRVSFFSYHAESSMMSVYYIITISFLFGVLISGTYGIIERFRLMKALKTLRASSQEKEQELNSLRNLPITSEDISQEETNESNGTLQGED